MLLVAVIILATTSIAQAQSTERAMSLQDVVGQVKQGNWDLQKMQQKIAMAQSDLISANSTYLPGIYFTETFTTTTDPMMAFGTKLGQSTITQEDFNPDQLNNPNRISNFNTRLNIEQPIFNLDGHQSRLAMKKNLQARHLDKVWLEKMLVIEAKNLYYQLELSMQAEEVTQKMLQSADSSLRVANHLFDQELIHKTDLMDVELYMLKMKKDWLKSQYVITKVNSALLQHMGETNNYKVLPQDSLADSIESSGEWLEAQLSDGRADLRSAELATEASKLTLAARKGTFVPRINAFGNYAFNDTQLFGTGADNYLVGVQLRWDLFKGGKQLGSVQKARFEMQHAELQLQKQRNEARRQFEQFKNDLQLAILNINLAERRAQQMAAKNKIRKDRYEEGLEKTSDLLEDQANLLASQLDVLNQKYNYLKIQLQLEAAASTETLNNN